MISADGICYTVVRSARKTIAVTVCDGRVTVRAPYGVKEEKIAAFVHAQADWIRKQLARFGQADARFASVKAGRTILVQGREIPLHAGSEKNGEDERGIFLKNLSSAKSYFMKTRAFLLVEKTAAAASRVRLYPEDVSVRDFKSRWGCCDAQKKIKLNWRLLMLPEELQEYVIVHELCHIAHLDHSAAFWKEVGKILPDYKEKRKRLKEYSFLTLLYR